MAFGAAFETDSEGKRHLLADYCLSQNNMESARYPVTTPKNTEILRGLERLRQDFGCTIDGAMNVTLEWKTGSDLDIQVRCPCGSDGTWHGYGTPDCGCKCVECEMERDHDIQTSDDIPPEAEWKKEHVFFKNSEKIRNKTIGFSVYNYSNNTQRNTNEFKIGVFNGHGHQLFPNRGGETLDRLSTMFCPTSSNTRCATIFTYKYTEEDIVAGTWRKFPEHAAEHAADWSFSLADGVTARNNQEFLAFMRKCQEKWSIVKERFSNLSKSDTMPDWVNSQDGRARGLPQKWTIIKQCEVLSQVGGV